MIGVGMSGSEYSYGGFPTASDLDFMQRDGVSLIRLPIAWELMQSTLYGPLNQTYLTGLENFLAAASARGMSVIVDLHNSGRYNGGVGLPTDTTNTGFGWGNPIGSAAVPISSFTDFWTKLAGALVNQPGIYGYDVMNEPHDMPSATTWPQAAQAVVNAIRTVDMHTTILMEGDNFSAAVTWATVNRSFLINDPTNNLVYVAHQYFDGAGGGGQYKQTYDQVGAYPNIGVDLIQPFLNWLQANNVKGFLGEFAVPSDDPRWSVVLDNVLNKLSASGVSGTYWAYRDQSGWWADPDFVNTQNHTNAKSMLTVLAHTQPTLTSSDVATNGQASSNVLTLKGIAIAGSTVHVLDGTTLIGTTTTNSTGGWTFTTGQLSNGTHTITVTEVNSGVTSIPSAILHATVGTGSPTPPAVPPADTIAPAAPTIADKGLAANHVTNDNTPTLTGTAEAGATVKIYDGATLLNSVAASGTGAWSYTTAALANGAHNLTATATDAAHNTSATSATLSVTIDTTAPAAPTIADKGLAANHVTNDNTLTLTGTAEANSTVKIYDGATLLNSVTASGTGAWSYTTAALANGAHNLIATATDAAGNTGAASTALAIKVDTTTPVFPPTTPVTPTITSFSNDTGVAGDHITSDNTLTLAGTAAANSTIKVYDGATLLGSAVANGSGAWSYTTGILANGTHSLSVTGAEVASTTGAVAMMGTLAVAATPAIPANASVLTITIDNVAPAAPTIADKGMAANHITNDSTQTLTGTAEAGSTVKVYDGTTLLGSAVTNSSGAWSYTTAALANVAHNLTATATDAAGNTGSHSTAVTATVDTTRPFAPTIADNGLAADHITSDNTPTLTGAAEANSTVKIYDGATLLGSAAANGSGSWSYTTAALANGAHSLTSSATDAAGNTGVASAVLAVTVDTNNSAHSTGGSGATGGNGTTVSGHGTGTTAPGSIDLWTLGLTDDHTVRAMISHVVAQNSGNLRDGNEFENHRFATMTLHQLESATGVGLGGGIDSEDQAASQLVLGSLGSNKIIGGPGADVLVALPGQHTMTGMGGADTFVIGKGNINATITDFTPGVDKLEFIGSAEHGNRTAQVRQELGNTVVTVGHDHVVLTGVDIHQLQPHDLSNLLV